MTDAEWGLIGPLLPERRRWGRPRVVELRAVVNALLYMVSTACQWRSLPRDYPPRSTVQGYFYRWRDDGLWQRIVDVLVPLSRVQAGRTWVPTLGIIDSQSVATTESGGPPGFDMGKRIKGCKRHIVTDTQGHLLALQVHSAGIQDCHGAVPLLKLLHRLFPMIDHILADRVYRGDQLKTAGRTGACDYRDRRTIARRQRLPAAARTPGRRTILRLARRCRRLAKDYETSIDSQTARTLIAHVRLLSRRMARQLETIA